MKLPPSAARKAIDEAVRKSFYFFLLKVFETLHPGKAMAQGWHLEALGFALEQVREGVTSRLLVTMPPRHLKSICASVAWPAWVLGHKPQTEIVCISYGQELAGELAGLCRRIIEAPWYARAFPEVRFIRNTEFVIKTSAGGGRRAATLQGALTGIGADLVIIDDLMKAQDAVSAVERERTHRFMRETLVPRLNDKQSGAIVVVAQRLHEDDLVGFLIATGRYTHLNLPAIAIEPTRHQIGPDRWYDRPVGEALCAEREDRQALDDLRREMGHRTFEIQYQQNPGAAEGGILRWEQVQFYDYDPVRSELECVVQSWDTGLTPNPRSDYSVGMTFGFCNGVWLLLDVVRGQWTYPELKRSLLLAQAKWKADLVLVEKAGAGISLIQDLYEDRRLGDTRGRPQGFKVGGYPPRDSKDVRFSAQVDKIETGRLLFPIEAPWLTDLRRELMAFPEGRHDDQVDALSQFLEWLSASGQHARLDRRDYVRRHKPHRVQTIRRDIARR